MRLVPVVARLSFAATLVTAVLIFTAALGRQFHALPYPLARTILAWGVSVGFAAIVIGFAWWIARLMTKELGAARWGYIGFIGAIAVMIVPLNNLRLEFTQPPLNDITTDTETPPAFKALLPLRVGAENPPDYDGKRRVHYDGDDMDVVEAQKRAYPDAKAVKLIVKPMALYWRAFEAAKRMDWNVVAFDKNARTIEATYTDFWTGSTSDIAIRVRPAGMGARLDIRSKSRVGLSDAGLNARIIKDYYSELAGG
ncbi:MAG TPA: DUF1499 domain-containing protein [Rhizomicrobium sp.]|nr:DUF1499 domain-containing protein [Rhizomicrobium sp.]